MNKYGYEHKGTAADKQRKKSVEYKGFTICMRKKAQKAYCGIFDVFKNNELFGEYSGLRQAKLYIDKLTTSYE